MEKLQITKDKIAQKYGFEAWDLFEFSRTPGLNIDALIDETITEYSSELLRQNREMKEALEKAEEALEWYMTECTPDNDNYQSFHDIGMNARSVLRECLTSCNKGKE